MVQIGDLRIDQATYTATYRDVSLDLTATEFGMIVCLAQAGEKAISYRDMVLYLRQMDVSNHEGRQMLSAHLSNLRVKMREAGCGDYLVNKRGRGYLLITPDQTSGITLAQGVFDSLLVHIAVLDESGTIVTVNKTWRDFATENATFPAAVCEGANYLAVCDEVSGDDKPVALAFATAIRAVLRGDLASFSREYACQTPTRLLWFMGRVTWFRADGKVWVVVAHENITDYESKR